MDTFTKLKIIVDYLNNKFPEGDNPFKIITRLAEETGELAQQVNHFEGTGVKIEKHGEPDKQKMLKEMQDVMRCVIALAKFYGFEDDLEEQINEYYNKTKNV